MNEELREEHLRRITDEKARAVYDFLCEACEKRPGGNGMEDADQMLVYSYARAEDIKQMCIDDIAQRGLGCERSNGRQRYWQENKAVGHERSSAEQQRKLLAELRLTPSARKAAPMSIDEGDFDSF